MYIMKIIVARYNENIDWTRQFENVVIYNKGDPLPNGSNEIQLSNVGREGHTYYKYICDNYYNLDNYTIFLQGRPFDHSPNIIRNLQQYINNPNLKIDFEFLSESVLDCNLNGCPHHSGIPLQAVYMQIFKENKTDLKIVFGAGAQFIVSKDRILQRPKEFYLKIVEILEKNINPIEGFVIERFHPLIFAAIQVPSQIVSPFANSQSKIGNQKI
jgi:hypothetical protein